jgi:hypothetical protein
MVEDDGAEIAACGGESNGLDAIAVKINGQRVAARGPEDRLKEVVDRGRPSSTLKRQNLRFSAWHPIQINNLAAPF